MSNILKANTTVYKNGKLNQIPLNQNFNDICSFSTIPFSDASYAGLKKLYGQTGGMAEFEIDAH